MANDKKITELPLLATPSANMLLYVVDPLDTTESPQGTSKAILYSNISSQNEFFERPIDPTPADNVASGYPLGAFWRNTTSGNLFYHLQDSVWFGITNGSYQTVTNMQASWTPDPTGLKYPQHTATRTMIENVVRAFGGSGFVSKVDNFTMIDISDTVLRISANQFPILFKSEIPNGLDACFKMFPQKDVNLSSITGITVDGIYLLYVLYDSAQNVLFSPTFNQEDLYCQLGRIIVKRTAGVFTFIDPFGTSVRNYMVRPNIASNPTLSRLYSPLSSTVRVMPNANTTIKHVGGLVTGISVNWGGANIDKRTVTGQNPLQFVYITPATNQLSVPPLITAVQTLQYWNGTAVVNLSNANAASVQRFLISDRGVVVQQIGEKEYATLQDAIEGASVAPFTDILPTDAYVEIGRMASKRSSTNLADVNQTVFSSPVNVAGGGSGGVTGTDLSYIPNATTGTIASSTGADAVIPAHANGVAGLLPSTDSVIWGMKTFRKNLLLYDEVVNDGSVGSIGYASGNFSLRGTVVGSPTTMLDLTPNELVLYKNGVQKATISTSLLTTNRTYQLPDLSGTILLTSNLPANIVTGSGTVGYLAKWSNTTVQTNSIIFDDGINVGIGTTSMSQKLTVSGGVSATLFVKSGATATNILLAGGTDIPQSTFAFSNGSNATGTWGINITGNAGSATYWGNRQANFDTLSTDVLRLLVIDSPTGIAKQVDKSVIQSYLGINGGSFILNQNASAQSANMWINGSGKFEGFINVSTGSTFPLSLKTTASEAYINMQSVGSGSNYGALIRNTGNDLAFYHGDGVLNSLYIKGSNGNVGIGTSTPDCLFQAKGVDASTASTRYLKGHIGGASTWGTNAFEELGIGFSGIRSIFTGGDNWDLSFSTGTSTTFTSGTQSERMRISSGGNVGIGTTNPYGKIQVKTNTNENWGLFSSSGRITHSHYNDAVSANIGVNYDALDHRFLTNGVEKARIETNGNVLIGTTTDNGVDKLQVAGSAIFTGTGNNTVTINSTSGAYSSFLSLHANGGGSSVVEAVGGSGFLFLKTGGNLNVGLSPTGVLGIANLSGTGTRTVVADASGNLSATALYKIPKYIYKIRLDQASTSTPTAQIASNNLGAVTIARISTGVYTLTNSNFSSTNIFVSLSVSSSSFARFVDYSFSGNDLIINNYTSAGASIDGLTAYISVEIYD